MSQIGADGGKSAGDWKRWGVLMKGVDEDEQCRWPGLMKREWQGEEGYSLGAITEAEFRFQARRGNDGFKPVRSKQSKS